MKFATVFEARGLAFAAARRATHVDAGNADNWVALSHALSHVGPEGPVRLSILGFTRRRLPDHEATIVACRRAHLLRPDSTTATLLARALLSSGEVDEPIALLRQTTVDAPADAAAWSVLAHAIAEHVRLRGVMTSSDVAEISHSLQTARALGHEASSYHLIRHSIRFGDWETAFTAANPGPGPTWSARPDEIEEIAGDPSVSQPADWWYVLSWKLRAAQRPDLGHQARRREAEERCRAPLPLVPTIHEAWQRARAHVVLDELDRASDVISAARRLPDPSGRLDRLAADLDVRQGRPAALAAWVRRHDTGLPAAPETRFRDLIASRDVVIVGPNATPEQRLRCGERFDVLIDTKRLVETPSSGCAEISYYADTSFVLFGPQIRALLDSGQISIAVLRPTFLSSAELMSDDERIRVMPTEDSLATDGSHFGIARAVYDVLQAAPRSVTLVGVDMFTAASIYPDSYTTDRQTYSDHDIAPAVPAFSHDLADDHALLARLFESGTVCADDQTAEILRLRRDAYLARIVGRQLN